MTSRIRRDLELLAGPSPAHYQFTFVPMETPRGVDIRASSGAPLRIGDRYTVGRGRFLYELIVEDITLLAGGQWSAHCGVDERIWL